MRYLIIFILTSSFAYAQKPKGKSGKRVIYKYKKYEKFDFENLSIDGDASSPGDLSISPRFRKRFRNKLPQRLNFNPEMKNAIQAIR
jgi:hypothetical protein